jgi:hypothetical protein
MTADSALKNGILFVANGKSEIDVVMKSNGVPVGCPPDHLPFRIIGRD